MKKKELSEKLRVMAVSGGHSRAASSVTRRIVTCAELRVKNRAAFEVARLYSGLKEANSMRPVFIDDRADTALACAADGVHLGKGDIPTALARRLLGRGPVIGRTVRGLREAKAAERDGADYVSIGPVFRTPYKKNIRPRGLAVVRGVVNGVRIPVVAIGGINTHNLKAVFKTGAAGAAMIRGIKKLRSAAV
ncbi:MAG: thiamine phosphate synthase [Candidatus Omnitrophota bacterium]